MAAKSEGRDGEAKGEAEDGGGSGGGSAEASAASASPVAAAAYPVFVLASLLVDIGITIVNRV